LNGLGKRLKQMRVARGMTQSELAQPYYTYSFVSAIESGRRRPSKAALEHFSDRLGVQADELLTGTPPGITSEVELGLAEARRLVSAGKVKKAEERFTEALRLSQQYNLEQSEARAMHGIALCYERKGKVAEAIEMYRKVQGQLGGHPTARVAESLAGEARCHQLLGDVRYAIHILESALELMQREGLEDPTATMRLQASLVGAYFEAGLYDRSYAAAEEALSLAPEVDDPERLAAMYINAAWALNHKGRDRDAHETLVRAEHFFEQVDLRLELAQCRLGRGILFGRKGDTDRATSEIEKAAEDFRHIGNAVNEARCLNELGRLARLSGDTLKATGHLERSIELLSQLDQTVLLAWAYREMGLTLETSDPTEALKYIETAIQHYERADQGVELAITYRYLGDMLNETPRRADSCDAYRRGILALERNL
jgi:tetratricopeptide (TPR) repeat protein